MKSGLYACAGASATASAAACANRFDEPITNESKVYLALKPPLSGRCVDRAARRPGAGGSSGASSSSLGPAPSGGSETRSSIGRSAPVTSRIAAPIRPRKWPSIQSRVKSFGTPRTKRSSDELEARCLAEPGVVRRVVEGAPEPTGNLAPQALRSQLDLVLHPAASSSLVTRRASIAARQNRGKTARFCRDLPAPSQSLHSCGKQWGKLPHSRIAPRRAPVEKSVDELSSILAASLAPARGNFYCFDPFSSHEAHLPAQRSPPQAQARLSRTACRRAPAG